MMKIKTNILYFIIFLLIIPLSYSITLEELINSYNYVYSSGQINITNIIHYGNDSNNNSLYDYLIINLTINNTEGNYTFTGDIYRDNNLVTTISDTYYLYDGQNIVQLYYNSKLLQNGIYNLSLTIQENYLTIYSNDNTYSFVFDNTLYEKPDLSVGINGYESINNDADVKYEILRINTNINSTINGDFEINALITNTKTINSKNNYSLVNGINDINIDFDGKEIRKERINNSLLYLITIKNGITYQFDFNYSLNYNLYDFDAEQSILLDSYSDGKIDLNGNNLSEFLELNISLDINESGIYEIELELNDLYDEYVKKEIKEFNLNEGQQIINFRINGTDIYNSKVNGPYILEYIKLSKDNTTLDSISKPYISNNYNYDEFERPLMPDLAIKGLEINNDSIKINLANEGDSYAFGFNLNIFDNNFNSIEQGLIDYLAPGNSENISYNINISNISRLYAIVDYDNEIEEDNESNNLFIKDLKEEFTKFDVSLIQGWNLISLPLIPNDKNVDNIFTNYSKIFTYNNELWYELNNNSEIDETRAYWVNSLDNQTLTIEGTEFIYPINFTLIRGWNLISYPSLNSSLINETLNNINYSVVYGYNNSLWTSYNPLKNNSLNDLRYFKPCYGYWVNSNENTSLSFNFS